MGYSAGPGSGSAGGEVAGGEVSGGEVSGGAVVRLVPDPLDPDLLDPEVDFFFDELDELFFFVDESDFDEYCFHGSVMYEREP